MPEGLLRITAVSGGRRSDLVVPGAVPVAELVPDLARAVGLLDPAAVYAGYRLTICGRRLRPDRGLREQGVDDGALLVVATGTDDTAPVIHDDLVEATADEVGRQRGWEPADTRRTTLAAGLVAVGVGLFALAWDLLPPGSVGAAVGVALVVLAGNALPAVAIAVGVAGADGAPVDPDRVAALVARSARVLAAGSVGVGLLVVLLVPAVADGPAGVALCADCCLVLLLRARRARSRIQVLADAAGGLAGLLATVVAVLVRHPDAGPTPGAAVLVAGLVGGGAARLPAPPPVLRARGLDLLETVALVALAPLLLVAADGLSRLGV